MSPRKIIDTTKNGALTEENKKLLTNIVELRQKLEAEEEQNENLRNTMREMIDDYSR